VTKLPASLTHFFKSKKLFFAIKAVSLVVLMSIIGWLAFQNKSVTDYSTTQTNLLATTQAELQTIEDRLASASATIEKLLAEDQRVRNNQLEATISAIQKTYTESTKLYEEILDLRGDKADTQKIEEKLASSISQLAAQNYSSASATLKTVAIEIKALQQKLAEAAVAPTPQAAVSNTAPSSGYSRQKVETDIGGFVVSLIAGDLSSTKVIVDTASGGDCGNDCPVLPLSDYVSRNGGYAGVNGSYFCPATYPSCAGKTNTFDLLVMNKDKVYFNSGNNVYSNNPAVIFGGSYIRFVGAASEWGRDTGIDSMLSNYPLLVSGNQVRFNGDGDPKKGSKGNRSFVANKGNTVYIGVVHGATVAEAAHALQTLGMDNALNLDSGGSTALWSGGYKVGPGRNIPNAIVFVRK
jgi:hypothetical protein